MESDIAHGFVVRVVGVCKQSSAEHGMRLHVPVLHGIKLAFLLQDAVRNGHLADIMNHGRKSQLIAITKALRLINVMPGSPLVIHGHGTLGNALYVSTGLCRIAHLRGGDEAHDPAAH